MRDSGLKWLQFCTVGLQSMKGHRNEFLKADTCIAACKCSRTSQDIMDGPPDNSGMKYPPIKYTKQVATLTM